MLDSGITGRALTSWSSKVKLFKSAAMSCSFVGSTTVLMADGTHKPIKDVGVGDKVVATDPETGEQVAKRIEQVFVHHDTVLDLVIDGEVIATTEDHPFWSVTDQRFERADNLGPGERVLAADGRVLDVMGLALKSTRQALAYNLSVEGIHTYHVGDNEILVHNVCGETTRRYGSLNAARTDARKSAGLGDDSVDFVQQIGPFKGRVTGRQSQDGLRGWRIDWDEKKGFHVNWWDRTGGRKRDSWKYGANIVEGGTRDDFYSRSLISRDKESGLCNNTFSTG